MSIFPDSLRLLERSVAVNAVVDEDSSLGVMVVNGFGSLVVHHATTSKDDAEGLIASDGDEVIRTFQVGKRSVVAGKGFNVGDGQMSHSVDQEGMNVFDARTGVGYDGTL